jgi:hypothetical protein
MTFSTLLAIRSNRFANVSICWGDTSAKTTLPHRFSGLGLYRWTISYVAKVPGGVSHQPINRGPALGKGLRSLAARPILIWEAFRAGLSMRRRGGLLPSRDYVAWRMHTAYGDHGAEARPEDLATYLSWRRRMRATR